MYISSPGPPRYLGLQRETAEGHEACLTLPTLSRSVVLPSRGLALSKLSIKTTQMNVLELRELENKHLVQMPHLLAINQPSETRNSKLLQKKSKASPRLPVTFRDSEAAGSPQAQRTWGLLCQDHAKRQGALDPRSAQAPATACPPIQSHASTPFFQVRNILVASSLKNPRNRP